MIRFQIVSLNSSGGLKLTVSNVNLIGLIMWGVNKVGINTVWMHAVPKPGPKHWLGFNNIRGRWVGNGQLLTRHLPRHLLSDLLLWHCFEWKYESEYYMFKCTQIWYHTMPDL